MLRRTISLLALAAFCSAMPAAIAVAHPGGPGGHSCRHNGDCFNAKGNILITDQFNNRVIEINPRTNGIAWSFGSGDPTLCNPGPGSIIAPNDAERLSGGFTLLAGTGSSTCSDNRVIVVDQAGNIVWQYGQAGVAGIGDNQLNVPVFAVQLPNRNILITDQANNRIIEVDRTTRKVVWSYGPTSGPGALNNPNSAEMLRNGDILIADENNNRVIEITPAGKIVWQYGSGDPSVTTPLETAAFASRLPNGDTLITDSGHSRIVEVNRHGRVVWQYFTNTVANSNSAPSPSNAVRIQGGRTLISDQFNDRILVVDHHGRTRYQYGQTNVVGNGPDQLNGPYSAYVIGDYTGQTPPPPVF